MKEHFFFCKSSNVKFSIICIMFKCMSNCVVVKIKKGNSPFVKLKIKYKKKRFFSTDIKSSLKRNSGRMKDMYGLLSRFSYIKIFFFVKWLSVIWFQLYLYLFNVPRVSPLIFFFCSFESFVVKKKFYFIFIQPKYHHPLESVKL